MRRRHLLLIVLAGACARARASDDTPDPRHKISAATLLAALSTRFPLRAGLRGLLEIELDSPRLLLLPERKQLGVGAQVQMRGVQLAPQASAGDVELVFGLRYETADRSVRAVRPQIWSLDWPGLSPQDLRTARELLSAVLRQVDEVVLQRLTSRDLALPQTLGLQPQELQVVEDGVLVHFGPAAPR